MSLKTTTGDVTFKSMKPLDLSCCTKGELRVYFENSYNLNESLFTALKDESAMYKCPDRLRLPLIFYYAHTAVVYVNKLKLAGLLKERINFEFEKIFETGVDEMSWDDTENFRMGGSYQWPSLSDVVEYRRQVRQAILNIIDETPLQLPITMENPWWGLMMGMEHERIHLETSSVLIRQLPVDMLCKPEGWTYAPNKASTLPGDNRMIRVQGKDITFGKPKDFPSYGWDNEYGEVKCSVPTFEASQYLVSNQEFLEFINAGGYTKEEYWTEEGWKWKQFREAVHPMFWVCNDGCKGGCGGELASYSHCRFSRNDPEIISNTHGEFNGHCNGSNGQHNTGSGKYMYRAMFDLLEMPWAWPVDVNYHEANAFCNWKGTYYRLLVEAEHNVIRGYQAPSSTGTSCDVIFSGKNSHNHNLAYGSSTPVNMHDANELGFYDVYGNVWQWMEDQFNGLSTETHWLYDDFSAPCFDGKHNVILGGSWISTGDEASRFARYAFRRHFLQHAGFRVARTVKSDDGQVKLPVKLITTEVFVLGSGVEENKVHLDQDMLQPEMFVPSTNIHYGFENVNALEGILEQEFGFRKSFPVAVAELCIELTTNNCLNNNSAIWIGAGTGRGPFLLSNYFDRILATDVVGRFVDVAMRLQNGNDVTFKTTNGQSLTASREPNSNSENIIFKQFTWIPIEVGNSKDLTVVTFLERVIQPKAWLLRLGEITKQGGLVVIASQSGTFGREAVETTLNEKGLICIEDNALEFESVDGIRNAAVTIWKHE